MKVHKTIRFGLVLSLLAVSVLLSQRFARAEDRYHAWQHKTDDEADGAKEEEGKRSKREKKKSFNGYSKFRKDFERICGYIEQDGRRGYFYDFLKPNAVADPTCPSCKSLFKTFYKACKEKRVKKKRQRKTSQKTGENTEAEITANESSEGAVSEPTPEPTPHVYSPQREPSLGAVTATMALFRQFADDEEYIEDHYTAAQRLRDLLEGELGKNKGQRDYGKLLAMYALVPFSDHARMLRIKELEAKGKVELWRGQKPGQTVELLPLAPN